VSDIVRDYYNLFPEREWERLDRPYRRLEFVTTLHLIEKYFPCCGHVGDIGGGPGRYTIALLKRGFTVTLVDLSQALLDRSVNEMRLAGVEVAPTVCSDARDLSFLADASLDAALFLGPVYHLVTPESRSAALAELRRVLKPSAPAIIAYLNSWGILRTLLSEDSALFRDSNRLREFEGGVDQIGRQGDFTEAHFTTPPLALAEVRNARFEVVSYAAAEGVASGMRESITRIAGSDPEAYANILRAAVEGCEQPQWRDTGEHMHIVVRKPAL